MKLATILLVYIVNSVYSLCFFLLSFSFMNKFFLYKLSINLVRKVRTKQSFQWSRQYQLHTGTTRTHNAHPSCQSPTLESLRIALRNGSIVSRGTAGM